MTTSQVKIFKDSYSDDLEKTINKWLIKYAGEVTVHDIKYSSHSGGSSATDKYSALIHYTTTENIHNEPIQLK